MKKSRADPVSDQVRQKSTYVKALGNSAQNPYHDFGKWTDILQIIFFQIGFIFR